MCQLVRKLDFKKTRRATIQGKIHMSLKFFIILVALFIYFVFLIRTSMVAFENNNQIKDGIIIETTKQINKELKFHRNRLQATKHDLISTKMVSIKYNLTGKHRNKKTSSINVTVNPIYEYSEELNAAIEKDIAKRHTLLNAKCKELNIEKKFPPNAWEFFISPGHNLAWCNVFKAGSTTWMYYFNILAGYDVNFLQKTKIFSPIELARKRFPRPTMDELKDALNSTLSFLIARDPFERLLSAYRDKIEGLRNKYYRSLGQTIIRKSRRKVVKERNELNKQTSDGPTFREFVSHLIQINKNGKKFDEHWTPIYGFCTPCSINYTVIAKIETFDRDTEYIIRQAGLEGLLLNQKPKKKSKSVTNRSSFDTTKLITKYYETLNEKLLNGLLAIYKYDFELFGYDYEKYRKIIRSSVVHNSLQ